MREKLITYVDFLFAGAPQTPDMAETKAEILQNTLDKFDDLVAQGKSPEAAYSLAVAGIGDVSELLTGTRHTGEPAAAPAPSLSQKEQNALATKRSVLRAIAVALYISCVLPPIMLDGSRFEDNLGPALMFVMIAIATALMVFAGSIKVRGATAEPVASWQKDPHSPQRELRRAITGTVWILGLAAYFIVSFATMAWHLTWLIFPITGVFSGLIRAILDLVEANKQ